MDDFTNLAELAEVSQKAPVLVIIEQHILARTCILNILKRELEGFEIVEMATTSGLSWFSGRDIRLIALNIGDKEITDPAVEVSLAFLAEFCPKASVALLSSRDDEMTISAAMQRGNPWLFPEIDSGRSRYRRIAPGSGRRGLPALADRGKKWRAGPQSDNGTAPTLPSYPRSTRAAAPPALCRSGPWSALRHAKQHVLEALQLGLPNKLIAVRLNLSENTVKMHIQRIMRKCSARNRTEAVLRWSRQTNGLAPRLRVQSS